MALSLAMLNYKMYPIFLKKLARLKNIAYLCNAFENKAS